METWSCDATCPYFAQIEVCKYYYCISGYSDCETCPHDNEVEGCTYSFPDLENRQSVNRLIKAIEGVNIVERERKEIEEKMKMIVAAVWR